MKKVLIGGGVLFVVIIGLVYFLWSNIDHLIKETVERVGSDATQATVSLNSADVDVMSGKGALKGLVVGNPAGFESDSAFELGEISVSIDTGSITTDTVVIREVLIAGPKVTYELSQNGSNVDAIKRNVDAFAQKLSSGSAASEPAADGGAQKKIVIELLTIRGGEVNVASVLLGDRKLGTNLPAIEVRDIGKDSGGASPAEIAAVILDTLTGAATKAATSLDLSGLLEGAAGQAVKDATKAAEDTAGSAVEGASDAVGGAVEGVKGLLGN